MKWVRIIGHVPDLNLPIDAWGSTYKKHSCVIARDEEGKFGASIKFNDETVFREDGLQSWGAAETLLKNWFRRH